MTYDLIEVTEPHDWAAYHAIRRTTLWDDKERTGYDETRSEERQPGNHPLLLKQADRPLGTTRLDERGDGTGVVRLVAIMAAEQGKGHGRELDRRVEALARRLGINTLLVNAAPEALGYYEKTGWQRHDWDPAELQGIAADCVQMRKRLVVEP